MSIRTRNLVRHFWDGRPVDVLSTDYMNAETLGLVTAGQLTVRGIAAAFEWFGPRVVRGGRLAGPPC